MVDNSKDLKEGKRNRIILLVLLLIILISFRKTFEHVSPIFSMICIGVVFASVIFFILDIEDISNTLKTIESKNTDYRKGDKKSGEIYINEDIIILKVDKNQTELKISDIKIIGETTTSSGPYSDDWFLVFIMDRETWYQIPMYAYDVQEVLKELSQLLNAEIVGSLFYSTSWKTNVIYPKKLTGKELFITEGKFMNKKISLNPELLNIL